MNHIESLEEQVKREPREFPKLIIKKNVKNIEDFVFEDFVLLDYNPHSIIKMKMAI